MPHGTEHFREQSIRPVVCCAKRKSVQVGLRRGINDNDAPPCLLFIINRKICELPFLKFPLNSLSLAPRREDTMEDCFTCDSTRVIHFGVLTAFSFAAFISVLFRLCARKIQMIRLELNDYLCIVGLVCTRPVNACGMLIESLDLHPRIDDLHDAFHCRPDFRPRRSQYELG